MPFEYGGGDYVKLPKVGEPPIVVTIKDSVRIEQAGHQFNFKTKAGDCGFHYQVHTDDGRSFRLGIWKLFYAFRDKQVGDGDTIRISHPQNGVWEVERAKVKAHPSVQKVIDNTAIQRDINAGTFNSREKDAEWE